MALLDLIEAPGAILVAAHLLPEIVDLLHRDVGLLADLLERLAGLGELRGAARHLREQCAQRGAFLFRLIHERLQLVDLLFGVGGFPEKCVKHGAEL